jgi:Family of unknown function (DUF6152)
MTLRSTTVLVSFVFVVSTNAVTAHHSFAMFDTSHPIEISGVVKEFRFVNPHSVLVVMVKSPDGAVRDWTLEMPAPGLMLRQGVNANMFRPGDPFKGTISPLHSGEPGGSYFPPQADPRNPVAAP